MIIINDKGVLIQQGEGTFNGDHYYFPQIDTYYQKNVLNLEEYNGELPEWAQPGKAQLIDGVWIEINPEISEVEELERQLAELKAKATV